MSAWDYIMPHRLLLNRNLRRASQELSDKAEAYQIEFNRRLETCKAELEIAEENKNKDLEAFKDEMIQELSGDYKILEEAQGNIVKYIDCFFYRSYLYKLKEIKQRQNDILHEDYVFLSNQIKSIDNEISILRERQDELTAFTKVDDIIHLATLTGYDLDFKPTDDARQLLGKISEALETYSGEDRVKKYALLRLKNNIQERSDYLPAIKYISWVIQIKRQFKKELLSRRSNVKKEQAVLREEMKSIKAEIQTLKERLDMFAKEVRYYWAKPITYLNADICYAYLKLNEENERLRNEAPMLRSERKEWINKRRFAISEIRDKKSRRRDVGYELKSMSDSHSSDQWRWDSLQSERKSLTSDIDSLSSDVDRYSSRIASLGSEIELLESAPKASKAVISSKKETRRQWGEKRTHIVKLIKNYDKEFRSNRSVAEKDEIDIITTRLDEIQRIRKKGFEEAQEAYQQEREEITRLHKKKARAFKTQDEKLQAEFQNAEAKCSKCLLRVSTAKNRLQSTKKADDTFVLVRIFSNSPAASAAKEELRKAQAALGEAQETKRIVASKIAELHKESETEDDNFQKQIGECKPRYLRPTSEEQQEERKLALRFEEINGQHGEGGYESKN